MSINVYWTILEDEWMRAESPESVYKHMLQNNSNSVSNLSDISLCPSIKQYSKNLYSLSSIYDYSFYIEDGQVKSNNYDQKFFNDHVVIRDIDNKFFSFQQRYLFFTDSDSLVMETYLHPFLENNLVKERCYSIPGSFDIGKWFRNVEFPFFLKDEFNEFSIKNKDRYSYIRFNTEEKIKFIKFIPTEKILFYANSSINSSFNKRSLTSLQNFYKMNTHKGKILKEIKNNLC